MIKQAVCSRALAATLVLVLALSGCGGSSPAASPDTEAAEAVEETVTLRIVTTLFPLYDWTMTILGDRAGQAEVTLLQDSGVDLHSYQPTAQDLVTLGDCDLFLYVGGESDEWVEDALAQTDNPDRVSLSLLAAMGETAKAEETVEGMEAEDHDHGEEEEDHQEGEAHHEESPELDEHIWLSLKNAALLCDAIAAELGQLDPENAALYRANAAAYQEKLAELDAAYAQTVERAPVKTILVADRFPFRYLADDYGLDYYAAFSGCSAETEASFETVAFLTEKLLELELPAVLCLEGRSHQLPETVADAADAPILTLDSMQSVTGDQVQDGASYLKIMEANLAALKRALGT